MRIFGPGRNKIADALQMPPRTVRHLIEKGRLPVFYLPGDDRPYAREDELAQVMTAFPPAAPAKTEPEPPAKPGRRRGRTAA